MSTIVYPSHISPHITFAEATKSQSATRLNIPNLPNQEQLLNMQHVATHIFEPLRAHFGVPIAITSFFRSPQLNKAIGGSPTSQHMAGEAIDIDADVFGRITNRQIFDYIRHHLPFDQLIWEFGNDQNPDWVHVSLRRIGTNRRQILRARKINGQNVISPFNPK